MAIRTYHVFDQVSQANHLVDASSREQAVGHIVRSQFKVRPLSATEALDMVERGVKRERAGGKQADLLGDAEGDQ